MSKTIGEMENRVMCGDCLQLLAELPDESINMIITSPPYADQIKDYGEKVIKIKPEKYVEWFLPRAKEFYRVLSSTGSFILNISDKLDGKAGMREKKKNVWKKYPRPSIEYGIADIRQ